MFTLCHGLYKHLTEREEFFVLILGLDNAGKTTYLEQAKTKFCPEKPGLEPSKVTTTVGLNIGKVDYKRMRLSFWDLGGQEELQALWDKYYSEAQGVIWLLDSNDNERFEESCVAFKKMITSKALSDIPLLLIANKRDLTNCIDLETIQDRFFHFEDSEGCLRRPLLIHPATAIHGDGVMEGIGWLADRMDECRQEPDEND